MITITEHINFQSPLHNSRWIAPSEPSASPIITRSFTVGADELPESQLYVTGLGFFEVYLNGRKLGDEYFQPLLTDYEPRSFDVITYPCRDRFTHKIFYLSYDAAPYLKSGENHLEIWLGGGWYVQTERVAEGHMSYGDRPKCIYSLKLGRRCIYSDGSETWSDSEIVYSNLFIGEIHDPTAAKSCGRVTVLPQPASELCPQYGAPDRLIRRLVPKPVTSDGERRVYDAGENISGLVRIHTRAGYTGELVLRFAENLNPDGTLNFASSGGDCRCSDGKHQIMCDRFVSDGSERVFEPKFVWHAFRYFEIVGEFDSLEVLVIHADTPLTAEFESDSEGLNFLFDAYVRTQLDNMHCGIPSDCPHRERLGYTGDGQICAPTVMQDFDCREFYRKWIHDILDCQDLDRGHVQHTAPFMGGGGGPGGWGCAIVLVPYYYWKQYGDLDLIGECYEPMKRWISYLVEHSENSLVTSEEEGGWCLGDWCTLEGCRLPEPFVNTCYFVVCLKLMCKMAAALGIDSDIPKLTALASTSLNAIRTKYYDAERDCYCDGTQGADVYAAWVGLRGIEAAAKYYDSLGHFDTGFLATDILCELLFDSGYGDVAYKLLSGDGKGSFLYMKRHGATTIWEHWLGASNNHPMFGAAARQLHRGILGIRQHEDSYGWERAVISPCMPDGLGYAKGSILTPRGRISVSLTRADGEVIADITVPDSIDAVYTHGNTSAKLASGQNKIIVK